MHFMNIWWIGLGVVRVMMWSWWWWETFFLLSLIPIDVESIFCHDGVDIEHHRIGSWNVYISISVSVYEASLSSTLKYPICMHLIRIPFRISFRIVFDTFRQMIWWNWKQTFTLMGVKWKLIRWWLIWDYHKFKWWTQVFAMNFIYLIAWIQSWSVFEISSQTLTNFFLCESFSLEKDRREELITCFVLGLKFSLVLKKKKDKEVRHFCFSFNES